MTSVDDVADTLIEMTSGRGPDGVIDAVGMEAHGSPIGKVAHTAVGMLPGRAGRPLTDKLALDRLDALHTALKATGAEAPCRSAASTAARSTRSR
jgi:threonine dehydrogenase-like Zn-dependent dehydrogenase